MWGGVITFLPQTASFLSTIELLHKSSRSHLGKKDHSYFNRELLLRNFNLNLVEFSPEADREQEIEIYFQFCVFFQLHSNGLQRWLGSLPEASLRIRRDQIIHLSAKCKCKYRYKYEYGCKCEYRIRRDQIIHYYSSILCSACEVCFVVLFKAFTDN